MAEKNWALGENGAKVVEVSHEAAHVASAASNLLVEREDLLWITSDAPQHVTLKLAESHPPLRYVGWHVWHDYLTNPKTVEVASGESVDDMVAQLVCQAVSGAGTQVWKLPNAIPPNHLFVRVKILETFSPGPTYMNNVVLFANDPGARFRGARTAELTVPKQAGASAARMSVLLKELDEDIRALHPIKTVSPKKNMLLYVPQEPMAAFPHEYAEEESASPNLRGPAERQGSNYMNRGPQYAVAGERLEGVTPAHVAPAAGTVEVSRGFNERLCALEQAVASLTQSMNHQREDLTMIKRLLLQQASERRRELEQRLTAQQASSAQQQLQLQQHEKPHRVSRHQVSVDFPEDALRSFVEAVVAPKLHKHTKRTEAQTIAKLDEFLKDIVAEITLAVDDRVRFHQQASLNNTGLLPDMAPHNSESRRVESTNAPPCLMKARERSSEVDCRAAQPAPATVPPRPLASSAATPPESSVSRRQGKGAGSAPVSIIRDGSLEPDLSFFRGSGENRR
ncbi:uncharacterized protein Tco025E_01859 [Trypanosoma conorhini]|uniref:Uncharacterized protein n=1 Tax=Trypanosoma conorhini TaxID=83891 RepID=A0A3R7LEY0_9TRYP|nr:uncharacterized protein Tco025E_01859 [Trypanosoma conorhini]RNF25893.1 hypothetical protein Tco025E_01859 [Trypanosoma conorhini]